MSLAIKYETVEDASMRLRNTVVLYKGDPVYITRLERGTEDEIFRVYYRPLPLKPGDEAEARKFISSKYFDIAPFRMGYLNDLKNGAYYCKRSPNRIQKQGLCGENFVARTHNGKGIPFNVFITNPEVVLMINNVYPTLTQAIKALEKSPGVAFSRDFCLVRDEVLTDLIYIYHKGEKVGLLQRDDGSVRLAAKFRCLKEALEELKITVKEM
jgi:hypothetical protein